MSWGDHFDTSGSFMGQDFGVSSFDQQQPVDNSSLLRAGGYAGEPEGPSKRQLFSDEPEMSYKKPRIEPEAWTNDYGSSQSDFGGPQSWGQLAEDTAGLGTSDMGQDWGSGRNSWNAPTESQFGIPTESQFDNDDWSGANAPTSWDQISSQGTNQSPGRGRGRGQGRGRGRGRGGGGGYGDESSSQGGSGWGSGGQVGGYGGKPAGQSHGGQFGGGGGKRGGQMGGYGGQSRGSGGGNKRGGQARGGQWAQAGGGGNKWGQTSGSGGGGGSGSKWGQTGGSGGGGSGSKWGQTGGGGGGSKWGQTGDSGNQWGQGGGGRGQKGGRGGQSGQNRGGQAGSGGRNHGCGAEEFANLNLVEKFRRFGKFLREDKPRPNAIQSIENACTVTGMLMKCDYQCDEVPRIYNRQLFTGSLRINEIFLARSVGSSKKEMKHEVYNKALGILTNSSIEEINDLKDPGIDMVKACVEQFLKSDDSKKFAEGTSGTHVYKAMPDFINSIMTNMENVSGLKTGIDKLISYLKSGLKLPDNPVALLEQAMVGSRCGLTHAFKVDEMSDTIMGKLCIEGAFILEDICIARAVNNVRNKKQCKQDTYIQALSALKTKSIAELVIPLDSQRDTATKEEEHEEKEAIAAGMQHVEGEGPAPMTKASLLGATVEEKMQNLRFNLTYTAFLENNEYVIDNTVCNSGLSLTCLYKKAHAASKDCIACELYIGELLITIGMGATKAECRCDAYNNAWEVITTSSVSDLIRNCKKLKKEETSGPLVLDTVMKGISGTRESNAAALRRYGFEPDIKGKSVSDMVIVEVGESWQGGSRRAMAFSILHHSATLNGMLLQWTFSQIKAVSEKNYVHEAKPLSKFKCQIFLQGQLISECLGYGKNKTRSIAAADTLFKMYDTHDCVRAEKPDYTKKWVQLSKINAEADLLRADVSESTPIDSLAGLPDRFIVMAICNRISKFFPRTDEEQLVIGPGLPPPEMKEIQEFAKTMGLKFDVGQHISQMYCVIGCKPDMQHIVQQLKEGGESTTYGGYKFIPNLSSGKQSDAKANGSKHV